MTRGSGGAVNTSPGPDPGNVASTGGRGRATVQVYSAVQCTVTAPDERQGSSDRISSGLTVHTSRADITLAAKIDNWRREQAV